MADKKNSSPLEDRIFELEAALEAAQTELETAKDGQVRALADLENFRRRQTEEQATWHKRAVLGFFQRIMPNLLELSLGAAHSIDEAAKSTINKFFADLSKHGFNKIEPQPGDSIDADRHEVLMAEDGEPGKVVRCLELGWEYDGHVVAPAKISGTPQ